MTREDVKKIFPDATDEQITSFLNQSNSDVAKEKAKNQKLKEQADRADGLEKELEDLKQQNMTEAEKTELERQKEKAAVDKELADLRSELAESKREALISKITSTFVDAGLSKDTYAGAIKAYASMPYEKSEDVMKEVTTFVKGVSEANKTALETAKATWEKETLDGTPNPGGGASSKTKEEESGAAKYAREYSKQALNEGETFNTGNAPVNF